MRVELYRGERTGGTVQLPKMIESLLDPAAYPTRPRRVDLHQTHISYVFVAGDFAYKVKKPVDFGFLDFSTLERRKFFCDEEVRLNRWLCPSVYLGVVAVTECDGQYGFEGSGEAVEWAVKMLRLDERRMMDVLVERGEATPAMFEQVAQALADFHARAAAGPRVARFGSLETIRTNTEENFVQTARFADIILTRRRYGFIESYTRRFLASGATFLARRVERGRIREGHGDVHLANICFTDGPCIYDCIEFNERFRCGDVASEVAFLAMDLDFRGRTDLADVFVDAYVAASGDGELYQLLDFYKCYRAFVRGKVCGLTLDEREVDEETKRRSLADARHYFELAYRYAGGKVRPLLVVTCGLSGTGKSMCADAVAERLGCMIMRSDAVRKRLAGLEPTESGKTSYRTGIYTDEMTWRTYRLMAEDAARIMAAGHSVILDATFLARWQRDLVRRVAEETDARFLLVQVTASEDAVRERLTARELERAIASDADWHIYLEQAKRFEPPDEVDEAHKIVVDTSSGDETATERVIAKLAEERVLQHVR